MQAAELTIVTILREDHHDYPGAPVRATVMVSGDLSRAGIGCLRAQLAGLPRAGVRELRLDLSGVRHHEPMLAGELLDERDRQSRLGGRLIITSADQDLRDELHRVPAPRSGTVQLDPAASGYGRGPGVARLRPETLNQP